MEYITEVTHDTSYQKPILKQQYRTPLRIISNILQVVMDAGMQGVMVSELSRKTNMSHNAAVEYCQKLMAASLVQSERRGRNFIIVVTTKGIEFFREFKKFQEFVEQMNLRY